MLTHFLDMLFLLLRLHVSFSYLIVVLLALARISAFACRIGVLHFFPLYLPALFSFYSLPSIFLLSTSIMSEPLLRTPLMPSLLSSVVAHILHTWDFPQNCIQNSCPIGPQHSLVAHPKPLRPVA
jgi:hypothetical protein